MTQPSISFELFPPKTDGGRDKLLNETLPALNRLGPEFFSCTYGAGGSTRDRTFGIVSAIDGMGIDIAPHLSFGDDDEDTVGGLLERYVELGIKRLVALRGDRPSGMGGAELPSARQLVEFVRAHHGDHFNIAVAAYPEMHPRADSFDSDMQFLKSKFDAGADMAITQYFYNPDAYFHFMDRCAAMHIDKPIHAGIMPITDYENLARFSSQCGAEIPRWICRRLEGFQGDSDSIHAFGVDVVSQLCQTLLDRGCPGFHFYTMNRAEPTATLCRNLGH